MSLQRKGQRRECYAQNGTAAPYRHTPYTQKPPFAHNILLHAMSSADTGSATEMLAGLCSAKRGQKITKLEAEVTQLKADLALSQQNARAAGKHVCLHIYCTCKCFTFADCLHLHCTSKCFSSADTGRDSRVCTLQLCSCLPLTIQNHITEMLKFVMLLM